MIYSKIILKSNEIFMFYSVFFNDILCLKHDITENFYFFFRDCRVVRDPQTLKSKGYGFVSFVKKSVSFEILSY